MEMTKLLHVSDRDDAVSEFVRSKIREWMATGRELQELARIAGVAKSSPSQVLRGTGVGDKTGPGYARAFGFTSYEDLRHKAYAAWLSRGSVHPAKPPPLSASQTEAMSIVTGLSGATEEHIRAVIAAFSDDRFVGRDASWWTTTILTELDFDRRAIQSEQLASRQVAAKQAKIRKKRDELTQDTAVQSQAGASKLKKTA